MMPIDSLNKNKLDAYVFKKPLSVSAAPFCPNHLDHSNKRTAETDNSEALDFSKSDQSVLEILGEKLVSSSAFINTKDAQ